MVSQPGSLSWCRMCIERLEGVWCVRAFGMCGGIVPTPTQTLTHDAEMLLRIRGEYLEMPGLRLTAEQAEILLRADLRNLARKLALEQQPVAPEATP